MTPRFPLQHSMRLLVPFLVGLTVWAVVPTGAGGQGAAISGSQLRHLEFRQIGPAVTGGRIHDVEALPQDPSTVYVATASGGIWKTTNKGTTWAPVFEHEAVSTFGDLAIAASNQNIVWAGTGEQNNRQSTSWGNGVYRSTDGGETWIHRGLQSTRHIGRVRVHPSDPDVVYVAALGNLWKASEDRGVFKTDNGGRTWDKVLFVDTLTGVVDLVMDPSDPNTLYAAAYQRMRRTWGFNGGGPGSGIYKTTDGGATWRELTNGIPTGNKGRIGLAMAQTNPRIVMATVEHADSSGTYRSVDGGDSWTRVNRLNPRPMYYSHIFIDPTDENRVYVLASSVHKSEDGGKNFSTLPIQPTYDVGVHSDFHTLWINPNNPDHFYLAGDGGLHESWDRGTTYIKIDNIPIAQFYGIGVDWREPYYVYGGLQDNHSWFGPSATRHWTGITNDDWRQIGFGDGMFQQPDPTNHRYVYGNSQNGNIVRLDPETGDLLNLKPFPSAGEGPYRWDWASPILVSQHDPRVVYIGANRLFVSRDRGESWARTEDLTKRVNRDTLTIMGVRGADIALSRNDGTSSYSEIVTIAESPVDPDVLWAGTDDGNVQVSQDGGETWAEVSENMGGVPSGAYVSRVIASRLGAPVAYATIDAHRDGDFLPYVVRTENFGATWTPLNAGLDGAGSANVIREHPRNADLLFLGTEHGLYVSTTRGAEWIRFDSNLPTTAYDDLVIHPRENDLVVGTHGRSIYILDDLAPLVEWTNDLTAAAAHLFTVRDATVFQYWKDTSYRGQHAYAGDNPPDGAILSYVVNRAPAAARIEITNASGDVVATISANATDGNIQRTYWDLRHQLPGSLASNSNGRGSATLPHSVGTRGPFVSPGRYTATFVSGAVRSSQSFTVHGDPEMPITDAEHRARETFLLEVMATQAELEELRQRGTQLTASASGSSRESLDVLQSTLRRLRRDMRRLAGEFNGTGARQGSLYPPTDTHRERFQSMRDDLDSIARDMKAFE